ncbi:uncharacterized protein LOC118324591 [Morone saxatilis]|uniref:uncharacterized protein LOC118324591 n=1 Tax=Morone saxatilis TaxID=34816 RepID=UPI0015E2330F|nr:uncharacterized protein LOC118324591 [Morone saxatilis]
MKNVFPKFALKQYSTYIAIIVIFIHNVVLDRDLECSCRQQALNCSVYMALPCLIIFVLQLWMDKTIQRTCGYRCTFFCVFLCNIFKAAFIGLLWVVSVLIDGDWFVCCWNDHSDKQAQLACKNKNKINLTLDEHSIIAELKNKSMFIGLCLLFCALCVAALMSPFGWMKCFWKDCCKRDCCYECWNDCSDKGILYYKVILDEEETVLTEILTKAAKDKLTEAIKNKIKGNDWRECFNVAKELIGNKPEIKDKTTSATQTGTEVEPTGQARGPQMQPTTAGGLTEGTGGERERAAGANPAGATTATPGEEIELGDRQTGQQVTDSRDAEGDTGGEAGGGRAGDAGGDGGEEAGGGRGDVEGEAGGSQVRLKE